MNPVIKEFQDDVALMNEVKRLSENGVAKENLYVLTHDDDRTDRIADNVDANTIGLEETGFDTAIANVFRKKGDELRAKFEEIGFDEREAEVLEEKLDHGIALLIHMDANH